MAKLSRQTKEIIKTVLFLLVVALLVIAYIIYPLNRTKATMARADLDGYSPDSLAVNDPAAYIEAGLPADTFRFEADIQTNLACLYIPTAGDTLQPASGTAILLHGDIESRDSLVALASQLHQLDYVVITYDQRATGLSTAKYRGEGHLEATDLQALISHLEIRNQIVHPLWVVGFELGADAALLAAQEEGRIDGVVAVNPYLTTNLYQDALKQRYQTVWFPFYRTIMWWWYGIRSGYGAPYRRIDDIHPVRCRTLVYANVDANEETERLREVSPADLLQITVSLIPTHDDIVTFMTASQERQ